MDADKFEAEMRAGEVYHSFRVPPGCWAIIRVDGRSFTALTKNNFERPFDQKFNFAMGAAAVALMHEFNALYASTHSDEISVLLPRSFDMFSREVEKLVTVAASTATAYFRMYSGVMGVFDGRIWVGATDEQVVDYFNWRQADAVRGALNSMSYWLLRDEGKSARAASSMLEGRNASYKNELLFSRGINFNDTPLWQRRGVCVYWESYVKQGWNPKTELWVDAIRRRLVINEEVPSGLEYEELMRGICANSQNEEAT